MTLERMNLTAAMSPAHNVNPVGKIAITTKKTEALKTVNAWAGDWEVPTGTPVLVVETSKTKYVKVIWEERTVFLSTDNLRLIEIGNRLDGVSFCITGELAAPREFFKHLIKLKGGEFKSSVSSNCDYLIVGAATRSHRSTKLVKARQLGIKIINEQQFFSLMAEGE